MRYLLHWLDTLNRVLAACCRIIIVSAFWLASKLFYSVKINGLEHDTGAPRTYLAISHKRDLDPIVMIPALLSHRGWRGWAGDIHFGLRGDAFSPGYLAHLLPHPAWLSRLLHPLSIGPVLHWLGARPLEHLHIRPAEEWIRELLRVEGDVRAGDVLAPTVIQDLATIDTPSRFPIMILTNQDGQKGLEGRQHVILSKNVILSAAKDLIRRALRSFAALRMTLPFLLVNVHHRGTPSSGWRPQLIAPTADLSARNVADRPLSSLLTWHYHQVLRRYCGPEVFIGPARRRAEQRVVSAVKEQLTDLGAWLWQGGSLYGAPEGRLSPDGFLSPITAVLHRVLRAGPPDTRIVPIFINYDFMITGRLHIFVDLAPAIENAPDLRPQELDARLRQAWLQRARFSCTQLASGFLMQASHTGTLSFTLNDLARHVELRAKALAAAGRHVDQRLLRSRDARKVAGGFLAYAERHNLVRRVGHEAWLPTVNEPVIHVDPGEVGYDRVPLTYAWNDLQEMLSLEPAHPHL